MHDYGTFIQYSYPIWSRPDVVSDLISGVVVPDVGLGVCVKFSDSRSNRSRYIELAHFVTDKRRTTTTDGDRGNWRFA